jgi:type II secretory pathway component PulM
MMMSSLSRRERLLIVGTVAIAALVGGWLLLVDPVVERNRVAQEVIPARQEVLARRLELVSRKDSIAAELEAVNGKINTLSGRFLTAATPAVAASELQKIVKDTAGQVNTEIRSERILPTVDRGEILEVPIEITVSAEIRQLVDLLARLEAAPKLMTIQDLKLRVVNVSQPKEILATITLSGFILTGRG